MSFRFLMNPCLFLLLNTLAACAALSAGSAGPVSRLDPSQTDPSDLRVALVVPKELVLRRGDAALGFSFRDGDAAAESRSYPLEVNAGGASDSAVHSQVSSGETLYILALAKGDARQLRALQAKIAPAEDGKPGERGSLSIQFSGGCWRGAFPAGRKVVVNAWMQRSADAGYVPAISNLDLMQTLNQANVSALPACVD
ncbi:hypothetical protein [Ensifer sp.]|uniref:hypothetical protein n=1 Tax=Ensifer sp. TaxID=1872086 RepID=UPI00289C92CC|nr:hypothetical protein [Ensifer sp.]